MAVSVSIRALSFGLQGQTGMESAVFTATALEKMCYLMSQRLFRSVRRVNVPSDALGYGML